VFLFFAVIAGALVIAVLIGGDVRRLSQIKIRHIELLLAAFAVKVAVAILGTTHSQAAVSVARPLNVIGAILLLAVVWFNRRIPGALLFGAGLTLNLIVILAFGGRMPVLLPHDVDPNSPVLALLKGGLDPLHVALAHPQGLWFIGDVFSIPGIGGHSSLVSIGDLLMAAGVAWLIIRCSQRAPALIPAYGSIPSK
jgi:cytochrome bd-type quinol oxidase subunit 2